MPRSPVEENDPETILTTLGKKYSPEIVGAAFEKRSAKEISSALDVPIATTYRRIEDLVEVGLLAHEDSVLTAERNRTDVYRRNVDAVRITFGQGRVNVEVEERATLKNALDDAWRSLPSND